MAHVDSLRGSLHRARSFDPLHALWRALTSVRVAIYLLAAVSLAALLGTLIPQVPIPMRGNPAAVAAWVEFQKGGFGPFTAPMERLGLFDVFSTVWFNALLALLLVAVAVCTANRVAPTWRSVARPQTRVADAYFQRARHRARRDAAVDPDALVTALRRRRYHVHRFNDEETVRLYADRFRWTQFATFVSHLSLILLLAGGLVTKLFGYDVQLLVAEGQTAPVFPVANARQIQIEVKKFVEGRDDQGRITDFRSTVVLNDRGVPVKEGEITVNGPLRWNGFIFHQAARQVNGAALDVRERSTGNLVYRETLNLYAAAPRPRLTVHDARGATLFDEWLVLPLFNEAGPTGKPTVVIPHPADGRPLAVTLRALDRVWWMEITELGSRPGIWAALSPGQSTEAGGLTFTYAGLGETAWAQVTEVPGVQEGAIAMMASAGVAGVQNAAAPLRRSEGTDDGTLIITNPLTWGPALPDTALVRLPRDTPVEVGDYTYTFAGRRAFSGIVARRDPGTGFIWVAVTLFIAAVCVTFYFPRRRLWAVVRPDATLVAGVADRGSRYGDELQRLLDGLPASAGPAARQPARAGSAS